MAKRVLVDVSQFMGRPIPSGVQRVLSHMADGWPGHLLEAGFGFLLGTAYVVATPEAFAALTRQVFTRVGTTSAEWAEEYLRRDAEVISLADVPRRFDAYLMAEPSPRPDLVDNLRRLLDQGMMPIFGIGYDAFPVASPWLFEGIDLRPYDRFFKVFSEIENQAFISQAARDEFEHRLRRRPCRHAAVVPLGADGLPLGPPETMPHSPRTVVAVGSVEPRKRQALLVEAMDELWEQGSDLELVVLGRPGTERAEFLEGLRRRSRQEARVTWDEDASDAVIAEALRQAAVLVFIGTDEGYGLPAVEALALGCPVIAAESLPALAHVTDGGQIRLPEVTKERLVDALQRATHPESNRALRQAALAVEVPTWAGFAEQLGRWMADALEQS